MQLSEKLKVRFPRLFHEKVKIHVGDGWEHILTNMCCELVKYTGDIEINHIKEKFGVLRVDIHFRKFDNDVEVLNSTIFGEIRDIIGKYEEASNITCYDCGNKSELTTVNGHWVLSICKSCKDKRENGREN